MTLSWNESARFRFLGAEANPAPPGERWLRILLFPGIIALLFARLWFLGKLPISGSWPAKLGLLGILLGCYLFFLLVMPRLTRLSTPRVKLTVAGIDRQVFHWPVITREHYPWDRIARGELTRRVLGGERPSALVLHLDGTGPVAIGLDDPSRAAPIAEAFRGRGVEVVKDLDAAGR